jgi:hypothetical protein
MSHTHRVVGISSVRVASKVFELSNVRIFVPVLLSELLGGTVIDGGQIV